MDQKQTEHYKSLYTNELGHLTESEIEHVARHLNVQVLKKGDFLLKRGEVQKGLGFIVKGLIRRYYINDKGNDITTGFYKEMEYITDYPAFIRQKPTKYFLRCLEDSVVITVPFNIIQESYNSYENGQLYGRLMAEKVLTLQSDRIEDFLFYTAEERYLKFFKSQPELMNRVSLTHLSTYLGIERQSLSRIRKRLLSK